MKKYDIVIIGGGASAMMCAAKLNTNKTVAILEAGYSLGKKILVTGNGRCNLTNMVVTADKYNCDISRFLQQHNQNDTLKYFNSIGLETIVDEQGRVYPFTNYARSVIDVLNKQILRKNTIDVFNSVKVETIRYIDNKYIIYDKNNQFESDMLIIATGNINNEFFNDINIKMIERSPSLVALKTLENTKNLEGIRVGNVKITAICGNKKMFQDGEVLFKDKGLSGIAIFNLSTLFARNKKYSGTISIDLLPDKSDKETCEVISNRCKIFDKVVDIFDGLFVPPVREEIFKRCKIDEQMISSKLTTKNISNISKIIHNLEFTICGHYDNNQVISGGVHLSELDDKLQSKKYKNLFVIGEAVNVDGECGGYNLQWAWTSGAIVSNELNGR